MTSKRLGRICGIHWKRPMLFLLSSHLDPTPCPTSDNTALPLPYTLHLASPSVAGTVCLCKLAFRVGRMEPNKTTEKIKGFFQTIVLQKFIISSYS